MRRYSRIRALVLSLFSPDLYRDVAANWRGVGFLYLLLILTLTWIPVLYKWQVGFREFAQTEFPSMIHDFPAITITKGVVSSPAPQPYYMKDPESGKTFFILDTTGQVTELPPGNDPMILLTKTELIYRNQRETKIVELSKDFNYYIDREKLQGWADWISGKFAVLFFLPCLIVTFIGRIIATLIYAVVGLIFNAIYQKNLTFGTLMRLAAVSQSAVIYIDTVFDLTGHRIPYWTLLGFALTCIYVSMAVRWAESRALPPSPYPPMPYQPNPYATPPGAYPPAPGQYPPPPYQPPAGPSGV
ncbi:MAG TPA: DUF1189 family protein [Tepidisphaeraceae bacterium]|nr:DUF1189 family protein [Tepidisphaeraceae bacterium]